MNSDIVEALLPRIEHSLRPLIFFSRLIPWIWLRVLLQPDDISQGLAYLSMNIAPFPHPDIRKEVRFAEAPHLVLRPKGVQLVMESIPNIQEG